MPTLKIDGKEITVEKGTTILQAARKLGAEIPVFCYHEKLDPMGACRVCMVEVSTPRGPAMMIACATPVAEGMDVDTHAAGAVKQRNGIIEMILANHPLDCPVCDRGGECDLQDNTFRFGPGVSRFDFPKRTWDDYDMGPYIARCQNRCVRCYRCVRYYTEIVGKAELGAYTRGCTTEIRTFDDRPLAEGLSGNLSEVCPVGALLDKTYLYRARPWEIRDQRTVCAHCSYGCSMRVGVRQGKIQRVKPEENDQVNEVWLCDRGRFAHTRERPPRIVSPMIRRASGLEPASWDEVTTLLSTELGLIVKEEGPGSIGGITSGRPTNEDLYTFQKFFRRVIGTNNIASQAHDMGDAFLAAFGAEAATNSIAGLEQCRTFFVLGSDLVAHQPLMGTRIRKAVRKGARFLSADSRPLRYNMPGVEAPLRYTAGTSASLILGLVRVILDEGLFDEGRTAQLIPDLTGLRTAIRDYDTERVAKLTGLAANAIRETARVLAGAGGVTYLFGEEVLESASAANAASGLVALAILTGSVGRVDAGLVPLIQECNAQGANDMGCRPDLLPGYKAVESAAARDLLAKLWGAALPAAPGLGMMPMLQAAAAGQMRALWVMGNNLLKSGGLDGAAEALRRVKLLIVQDLYLNETALAAHIVLPARSYSERQGTFTSIERRVQSIREIVPPPENTLPDWQILAEVARKMGKDLNLTSPANILREIGQATPLYAGISFDSIGRDGQCWQFPQ